MKLLWILLLICLLPPVQGEPSNPSAPATPGAVHQGKGLTVELTSEVSAIRPGQPFYAGLYVRLVKGWHIYWKNPGLAGVPVNLQWKLPAGWAAGEIEWPAPYRVKMASINTHGFERDVMLMANQRQSDLLSSASDVDGDGQRLRGRPGSFRFPTEGPVQTAGNPQS